MVSQSRLQEFLIDKFNYSVLMLLWNTTTHCQNSTKVGHNISFCNCRWNNDMDKSIASEQVTLHYLFFKTYVFMNIYKCINLFMEYSGYCPCYKLLTPQNCLHKIEDDLNKDGIFWMPSLRWYAFCPLQISVEADLCLKLKQGYLCTYIFIINMKT